MINFLGPEPISREINSEKSGTACKLRDFLLWPMHPAPCQFTTDPPSLRFRLHSGVTARQAGAARNERLSGR